MSDERSDFDTDMQTIRDYVNAVVEAKDKIATAYLSAIDNFQTTVQSASKAEARPDILGAVMKSGLKAAEKVAVTEAKNSTGADLGPLVDMMHGIYEEIDRAAKAAKNLEVAEWIKGMRTSVTNAYTQDQTGTALRKFIEEAYNANGEGGRGGYIGGVQIELEAMQAVQTPITEVIEAAMYQAWINENFDGDCMDGTGTVNIEFNVDGTLATAVVNAAQGDKLAGALNNIMSNAGITQLMNLDVVKKLTRGDRSMCYEGNNGVRKDTDDEDAHSFLDSPDTWALATRFD